jgi:hypothetical protein
MTRGALKAATRVLVATVAVVAVVLVDAPQRATFGVEPTTCSYPPTLDSFQQVAPGDKWNAADHNRMLCALNSLERRSKQNGAAETVCTTVNVSASTRQLVNIGLASTVSGTEPVFASVIDTTNPTRMVADGIQGLSGTVVTVAVFNHDASNARTGKVCASVVRP